MRLKIWWYLALILCLFGMWAGGILYSIEMTEIPPLSQGFGVFLLAFGSLVFGIAYGSNMKRKKKDKEIMWRYITVFRCKKCKKITDNCKEHTIKTGHIEGYEKIKVPIDKEAEK